MKNLRQELARMPPSLRGKVIEGLKAKAATRLNQRGTGEHS
ncbi:MAG: hypothetical protein ACREUG_09540 [Steroidobacteraceae bacterium]